jgi:hypothetical protein
MARDVIAKMLGDDAAPDVIGAARSKPIMIEMVLRAKKAFPSAAAARGGSNRRAANTRVTAAVARMNIEASNP